MELLIGIMIAAIVMTALCIIDHRHTTRLKNKSVVFWVSYRDEKLLSHKLERFHEKKSTSDFYEWLVEAGSEGKVVLNCGIIKD